ncbi:SRPBCC domain-containing protein [Aeromicrobium wangtongii]|uniref:SRPBCC domain-containing protein n=1 Tax=Aeromicrobium wangtongii TaxID=2969247 RepID=A0ABY5M7I1_9ACTN|nr:SRPBCC domain-containing protein [Aeromicrobium wangtongii]MCD9199771.1 SRPBCC domain-containing protein [Aeromicrobium wangtongii]UUP14120.1 SRPBCC domain-containing protein [Aeromicrobium wangtongii]
MTSTRTQTHATFVVERDYAAPLERVWAAFADADVKRQWFGGPEFTDVEFSEDFRVGGTAIDNGTIGGHRSEFRASYTDIVEHERIVYTYDMWADGVHASTSISTIVLEPTDTGTHLTITEQGVYLDGVHGPGAEAAAGREQGTSDLLDKIAPLVEAAG